MAAVVAGITALLSTAFLMRYFRQHDSWALNPFAYYCVLAGRGQPGRAVPAVARRIGRRRMVTGSYNDLAKTVALAGPCPAGGRSSLSHGRCRTIAAMRTGRPDRVAFLDRDDSFFWWC